MSNKKILCLGAAAFQMPPIEYALQKGYTVITADNCQQNPGHRLAHSSYVISTIDKNAILEMARNENIDGIMTYGSDVSAPTVAFVCNAMGLPGHKNSIEAIDTLVKKDKFRQFTTEHHFQNIFFKSYDILEKDLIESHLNDDVFPLVVKPVDASGSKGVSKVDRKVDLFKCMSFAFEASLSNRIIIESFVEKKGMQICGDGFMQDGKLVFIECGQGYFYDDINYMAPYAESFPSNHSKLLLDKLTVKLEAILIKVGYSIGAFNFDAWITPSDEIFISEIGPRNGGNFIPSIIRLNTGVDLVAASVESAIHHQFSFNFQKKPFYQGYFAGYMVHALRSGILEGIDYDDYILSNIYKYVPYIEKGDKVMPFKQANYAIGHLMLKFASEEEMNRKMNIINSLIVVRIN